MLFLNPCLSSLQTPSLLPRVCALGGSVYSLCLSICGMRYCVSSVLLGYTIISECYRTIPTPRGSLPYGGLGGAPDFNPAKHAADGRLGCTWLQHGHQPFSDPCQNPFSTLQTTHMEKSYWKHVIIISPNIITIEKYTEGFCKSLYMNLLQSVSIYNPYKSVLNEESMREEYVNLGIMWMFNITAEK